jgi:NAD(P)-dependent dehydrogenase (short-subunit alcohol dehydrogenase family)
MSEKLKPALVVGAARGLGWGFVKHLLEHSDYAPIFAVCRNPEKAAELQHLQDSSSGRVRVLSGDVTQEADVERIAVQIKEQAGSLHFLINCVGYLHNDQHGPEKSLRQINAEQMHEAMRVNTLPTVFLAKHLHRLFRHPSPSIFAAISARVGSIADNRAGGWYSYRASKAALNMLMSNIAIEFHRVAPQTKVVALHPGTVATNLSAPFQKNVAAEKLFTVEYSVASMMESLEKTTKNPLGELIAWDGEKIPW